MSMKETRIVFMGTPDFAVPALRALHENYSVVAVVTQPDRPSGRGKKMTQPPVKVTAEELGILVSQPKKIRDDAFLAWLRDLAPDFIVTAAYGRILPAQILDVPKIAPLNIHASLLPRWRGAAPIHRAVIAGDRESGVTVIYMDEGMDTGDVALKSAVNIGPEDTTGNLHDKLSSLGAEMIVEVISSIIKGTAKRTLQDETGTTAAPPLQREEERIDWCAGAATVHNLVRGMNPWPGAYTLLHGTRLKIWSGQAAAGRGSDCGIILQADTEGILVATGDGAYRIAMLQPPGKKPMKAADFLRGNPLSEGTRLGI